VFYLIGKVANALISLSSRMRIESLALAVANLISRLTEGLMLLRDHNRHVDLGLGGLNLEGVVSPRAKSKWR
jgi:hypothetical protein